MTMNPGKELNELVAKHVMGWTLKYNAYDQAPRWITADGSPARYDNDFNSMCSDCFQPSIDIRDAWEVVEHFHKAKNLCFSISGFSGDWNCEIDSNDGRFLQNGPTIDVYANGTSAPHAICLAALKAVGVEV